MYYLFIDILADNSETGYAIFSETMLETARSVEQLVETVE